MQTKRPPLVSGRWFGCRGSLVYFFAFFFAADFLAATFFFTGIVPSLLGALLVDDRIIRLAPLRSRRLRDASHGFSHCI